MDEIARMAGFYAAHGIWSVSDGATLIPLLGYAHEDGSQGMDRLMVDDPAEGGPGNPGNRPRRLEQRGAGPRRVPLLETGRKDALIVEAVGYLPARRSLQMAIPYRPGSDPQGFGVYRPKFFEAVGVDDPDYAALAASFFGGVDSHEKAAAVWNERLPSTSPSESRRGENSRVL